MSNIITLFRQDSSDEFERLVSPHIERLFRLAYRYCGETQKAEDLVQDLLLKLYPKRRDLAEIEVLGPWLARSLYNLFIDSTRREQRNPLSMGVEDEVLNLVPGTEGNPEQSQQRSDMQRQLEQAMSRLSPEQRAVVNLHDVEGYTLQELETMLGTPIGTLKSRLHRSRMQLRKALQAEPISEDERVEGQIEEK